MKEPPPSDALRLELVFEANIAHFGKLLEIETDPDKRADRALTD